MHLPRKPRRGDPVTILPDVLGDLIDCVRSNTIFPSGDIILSRTPSGTTLHLRNRSRPRPAPRQTPPCGMFACTAAWDSTEEKWAISTRPGTAQPLYGQVQLIPALDGYLVAIPEGGFAIIYATLNIYQNGEYSWAWSPTLSVSTISDASGLSAALPDSWQTKYQAIALVDHLGNVSQGHEGAIVLPLPKSIVDLEPPQTSPPSS